ncbi:MAG: hypothetical protein GY861_09160 [bacterium]|nr:hypothetical protein [bacterium]
MFGIDNTGVKSYIREQLLKGHAVEDVKHALHKAGYEPKYVHAAVSSVKSSGIKRAARSPFSGLEINWRAMSLVLLAIVVIALIAFAAISYAKAPKTEKIEVTPEPQPEPIPEPVVKETTDICEQNPTFKKFCYFKRALEERDSSYCTNIVESTECIKNVAAILRDDLQCAGNQECITHVSECNKDATSNEYCRIKESFLCNSLGELTAECVAHQGLAT